MGRRKKIDTQKLIEKVQTGKIEKDTLERFGANGSTVIKVAPEILSASKKPSKKPKSIVKVNKRGSISIPKGMVSELGLEEGDIFQVRKTKAGISLKKA